MRNDHLDLGTLITALYDEYLDIYQDEDLAAVATAATIQELLAESARGDEEEEEAA